MRVLARTCLALAIVLYAISGQAQVVDVADAQARASLITMTTKLAEIASRLNFIYTELNNEVSPELVTVHDAITAQTIELQNQAADLHVQLVALNATGQATLDYIGPIAADIDQLNELVNSIQYNVDILTTLGTGVGIHVQVMNWQTAPMHVVVDGQSGGGAVTVTGGLTPGDLGDHSDNRPVDEYVPMALAEKESVDDPADPLVDEADSRQFAVNQGNIAVAMQGVAMGLPQRLPLQGGLPFTPSDVVVKKFTPLPGEREDVTEQKTPLIAKITAWKNSIFPDFGTSRTLNWPTYDAWIQGVTGSPPASPTKLEWPTEMLIVRGVCKIILLTLCVWAVYQGCGYFGGIAISGDGA